MEQRLSNAFWKCLALDEAAVAALDDLAQLPKLNIDLLQSTPARDISAAAESILRLLDEVDLKRFLRKLGFINRFTGADAPSSGRGRKGQAMTQKTPVIAIVQRPAEITPGSPAGDARATVVRDLSLRPAVRVVSLQVELRAHLMSDEAKAFVAIGESFAKHETVNHSDREYVRDAVHINSVEGSNDRARRTITGVPSH